MRYLLGKRRNEGSGMPGGPVELDFPVWFSRHGQTDWNKAGRFQGHSDIPLNAVGRQQAARNGRALRQKLSRIDDLVCVSSPLVRATETLEIIREKIGWARRRYMIDDRLIEIDLGDWNGRTTDEIKAETPDDWAKRDADKWGHKVPGGESYADAAARTREFLLTLTGPTLIVGHGASGRILRGYLCNFDRHEMARMKTPQGVVWELHRGKEKLI